MKKFDWKKYIYKIVVVILVIFFVGGVGIGAANILAIEGVREIYTPDKPLSKLPETNEEIIAYADAVIAKALNEKPMTNCSERYSIEKSSVENSLENSRLNSAAVMAVDEIENRVESGYEEKTAGYGESAAAFLNGGLQINPGDIESVDFNRMYYKCSMCTDSVNYEDFNEKCPKCGNLNSLELRYSDNYEITLHIKPDSESFKNSAFPKTEKLESIFAESAASVSYYTFKYLEKDIKGADVFIKVNRLTDKIETLRFETTADNTVSLNFGNEYSELNDVSIKYNATDKIEYSFTWPGLKLNLNEKTVELGSSEVLKATLTCDDPVKYDVTWSSSDEDILTVDEEGYLKTHKQFGDAVITAKFMFNGAEYSDSCLVHVGVPAEGVDLSRGKLKMKTGDTQTLTAEFDPSDTTNTKCYWFCNNEKVAKVDESGKVTATGKGKTTVYVITDDGNYYSSCKVEVTD